MGKTFYFVSEIARRFKIAPRVLSDLFYQRELDDNRCPNVGGRRIIPADYLPEIETVLREIGAIKKKRGKASE
jgi:hypothetical protein